MFFPATPDGSITARHAALSIMRFEFATATRILFGEGSLREIGGIAKNLGRRALVVTGRDTGRAQCLAELLRGAGVESVFFSVSGEPMISSIEHGAAKAREEKCDIVIGFGGGSAIDAAKAIAAMIRNGGAVLDYLEVIGRGKALTQAPAPFIAIPTTAGTGSEVTRNSVLASPEHRVKVSLRSPLLLASVAIIDPELTYNLPPRLTASTGLDALTQLIEPFLCARTNPMTDALCVEGLRRAARSLRAAFENGRDAAARQDMAVASLFGGLVLANAGLGAVHGLAGVIGGSFAAPHGAVCAILLPDVMETNLRALAEREASSPALRRFEEVARLITSNGAATAADGIAWVRQLVRDLRIPGLADYGIGSQDVADIVDKSMRASSMKANPIALTAEELAGVLRAAL
jgi:alcohol dehydrogenase class IV